MDPELHGIRKMTKNTAIMSKTVEILGEQAGYYLSHVCRTIDKKT